VHILIDKCHTNACRSARRSLHKKLGVELVSSITETTELSVLKHEGIRYWRFPKYWLPQLHTYVRSRHFGDRTYLNQDHRLDLLNAGHVVVFQLRSLTAFDNDQAMQPFVQSGKAILTKGDALNKQDVKNAWKAANEGSPVDLVLFTVGP
jgi:hypothetical protein